MKIIGWFFMLCVALAVFQTAASALLLLGLLYFPVVLVLAPKQVLSILFVLVLIGAMAAHPLAGLVLLSILAMVALSR